MKTQLRCGVLGLPAAETALVRTLFRLYQHGASDFRWALVDVAPYDALLVDAQSPHLAIEPAHKDVKAVLTLTRPLRSEMLEAWLLQTQREQFPVLMESSPAEMILPLDTPVATTAYVPDASAYKLTRWPPSAMLRNDASLIRMATLLSRRAIKVSELAQVSQQPLDAAYAFVLALRDAKLLSSPAAGRARSLPPPESRTPRTEHAARKIERSLMHRIRLRLGL